MTIPDKPIAIQATDVPPRSKPSIYPAPFAAMMAGREKRQLGEVFGLTNFGVNIATLQPSAQSALRHCHARQDEFIYVLQGTPTLITDAGETELSPGMCAGFKAGEGDGHHLVNRGTTVAVYLEVGDRTHGDSVVYPDDDLEAHLVDGNWQFRHKNGEPY